MAGRLQYAHPGCQICWSSLRLQVRGLCRQRPRRPDRCQLLVGAREGHQQLGGPALHLHRCRAVVHVRVRGGDLPATAASADAVCPAANRGKHQHPAGGPCRQVRSQHARCWAMLPLAPWWCSYPQTALLPQANLHLCGRRHGHLRRGAGGLPGTDLCRRGWQGLPCLLQQVCVNKKASPSCPCFCEQAPPATCPCSYAEQALVENYFKDQVGNSLTSYWIGLSQPWAVTPGSGTW
jgi:hypothetical protein